MKKAANFLQIPINRIIALVLMDIMAIIVSSFGALFVRFEFSFKEIEKGYLEVYERIIPYTVVLTLFFFFVWKLYKSVWRYASATELINIICASSCAAVGQIILCYGTGWKMPRSYYALYWLFLFGATCAIRFSYRMLRIVNSKRISLGSGPKVNVMLIGAGAAADMILKEIELSQFINLRAKCIIDDQPGCHGKLLRGVPIVGGRDKIVEAVREYGIDEIIFAIPSASRLVKKEILDICKETGCKLRAIPGTYQLINGEVSVSKLKEVEIEDLLGREPVKTNIDEIMDYVGGKVVMVTGGGGSIGSELCRQIAGHSPKQMVIVDIYENNAYDIQQELNRKYPGLDLVTLIASVRNTNRMDQIFEIYRPDIVYHAAGCRRLPPTQAAEGACFLSSSSLSLAAAEDLYMTG